MALYQNFDPDIPGPGFRPTLIFLGTNTFQFGFPNETYFAGPYGARPGQGFSASLTRFKSCVNGTSLNYLTNECEGCPSDRFFDDIKEECICKVGYMSPMEVGGSCVPCPSGTFSDVIGAVACKSCDLGRFTSAVGQTACARCEKGTFAANGAGNRTSCPGVWTTAESSSTEISEYGCPEGTYDDGASTELGRCLSCPEAMTCSFGSDTRSMPGVGEEEKCNARLQSIGEYPKVKPGFMTLPEDAFSVYYCAAAKHCPGGAPGTCANNRDPTMVACGECLPDTYEGDEGVCLPCEDVQGAYDCSAGVDGGQVASAVQRSDGLAG